VYSLVGLAHFYRDPLAGVLSRHETVGRAPLARFSCNRNP
jgi:hypothetical protein